MKIYISNAFSLSMLNKEIQLGDNPRIPFSIYSVTETINNWQAFAKRNGLDVKLISCVGHADTAKLFTHLLGREIACNRESIVLQGDFSDPRRDRLLVGQVMHRDGGPYRLPEGCTQLPEDAIIEWWTV